MRLASTIEPSLQQQQHFRGCPHFGHVAVAAAFSEIDIFGNVHFQKCTFSKCTFFKVYIFQNVHFEDVASAAAEGFFSKRWIADNLFNISEEEFLRNQREIAYDKIMLAQFDVLDADAGTGGGGGAGGLGGGDLLGLGGDTGGDDLGDALAGIRAEHASRVGEEGLPALLGDADHVRDHAPGQRLGDGRHELDGPGQRERDRPGRGNPLGHDLGERQRTELAADGHGAGHGQRDRHEHGSADRPQPD